MELYVPCLAHVKRNALEVKEVVKKNMKNKPTEAAPLAHPPKRRNKFFALGASCHKFSIQRYLTLIERGVSKRLAYLN
jgi:hypothetical protein